MKASACSTQKESLARFALTTSTPTKRSALMMGAEKYRPGMPLFRPTAYWRPACPDLAARKYSRSGYAVPTKLSAVLALLDAMHSPLASRSQTTSAPSLSAARERKLLTGAKAGSLRSASPVRADRSATASASKARSASIAGTPWRYMRLRPISRTMLSARSSACDVPCLTTAARRASKNKRAPPQATTTHKPMSAPKKTGPRGIVPLAGADLLPLKGEVALVRTFGSLGRGASHSRCRGVRPWARQARWKLRTNRAADETSRGITRFQRYVASLGGLRCRDTQRHPRVGSNPGRTCLSQASRWTPLPARGGVRCRGAPGLAIATARHG